MSFEYPARMARVGMVLVSFLLAMSTSTTFGQSNRYSNPSKPIHRHFRTLSARSMDVMIGTRRNHITTGASTQRTAVPAKMLRRPPRVNNLAA